MAGIGLTLSLGIGNFAAAVAETFRFLLEGDESGRLLLEGDEAGNYLDWEGS